MDKLVKNRSIVTYKDFNKIRKISSNDVEVELLSHNLMVDYECFKNSAYAGEPCTFNLNIHNLGRKALVNTTVFFNFSENLIPIITSVYVNKRLYKKGDLRNGIYIGSLATYETINIVFMCKVFPSSSNQTFSQALVTYSFYDNEMLINLEQFSNLVSIKVLG